MKEKILAFIHSLILYDYILFGSLFFLFILFLIIAILKHKNIVASLLWIVMAFLMISVAPIIGYKVLHYYLFKNSIELVNQKKLHFLDAIVVKAKLTNESKFDFKECKVIARVHKGSSNSLKNFIYQFRTIKQTSTIEKDITSGKTRDIKLLIEPFSYQKKYQITLKAKCQ